MKINIKKLLLKNILPSLLIEIGFIIWTYLTTGYIASFSSAHIGLFVVILIITFIFWELLNYFQEVTGMVMKESWLGRIAFIIGVLLVIYLYKATGRI